jgi:hypothetical protein
MPWRSFIDLSVKRSKRLTNKIRLIVAGLRHPPNNFLKWASKPPIHDRDPEHSISAQPLPIKKAIFHGAMTPLVTAFWNRKIFLNLSSVNNDSKNIRLCSVISGSSRVFQQVGESDLTGRDTWLQILNAEVDESNEATL